MWKIVRNKLLKRHQTKQQMYTLHYKFKV